MNRRWLTLLVSLLLSLGAKAEVTLEHGRFQQVSVFQPAGEVERVALLVSGESGWNSRDRQWAQVLAKQGTLVIGIDSPQLSAQMARDGNNCGFPSGDLENLSHFVQAYVHLPTYQIPFLVGEGSGAAFAFATSAQAPAGTFAGLLTLDFCPELKTSQPICDSLGLHSHPHAQGDGKLISAGSHLSVPWLALRGDASLVCPVAIPAALTAQADVVAPHGKISMAERIGLGFNALAHRAATSQPVREAATDVSDLPLVEVPVVATHDDRLVLFLSGDGGWAGLDKSVAAALTEQQVAVVGWDSLRYFWTPRTPTGIAADADRVLRYYLQHWHKQRVILVGYSQGANVLPFLLNRLPQAMQARVSRVVLMGVEPLADFEFHLSNWVSASAGQPVLPEIERMHSVEALCIYGEGDKNTACPLAHNPGLQVVRLTGGHHFDGDYGGLANIILGAGSGKS